MARIINYSGMQLEDLDPAKSVDEVRKMHAKNGFPALANASVVGPTKRGEDEVWDVKTSVATKG